MERMVLVAGASGYVGGQLIPLLLQRGPARHADSSHAVRSSCAERPGCQTVGIGSSWFMRAVKVANRDSTTLYLAQ